MGVVVFGGGVGCLWGVLFFVFALFFSVCLGVMSWFLFSCSACFYVGAGLVWLWGHVWFAWFFTCLRKSMAGLRWLFVW